MNNVVKNKQDYCFKKSAQRGEKTRNESEKIVNPAKSLIFFSWVGFAPHGRAQGAAHSGRSGCPPSKDGITAKWSISDRSSHNSWIFKVISLCNSTI